MHILSNHKTLQYKILTEQDTAFESKKDIKNAFSFIDL
jgi:hypothetical protein